MQQQDRFERNAEKENGKERPVGNLKIGCRQRRPQKEGEKDGANDGMVCCVEKCGEDESRCGNPPNEDAPSTGIKGKEREKEGKNDRPYKGK